MSSYGVANLVEEYGRQASLGVFTAMGATPGGNQTFSQAIARGMASPFLCTVRSPQKNSWFEGLATMAGQIVTFTQINTNSAGGNVALDMTGATVILYNQVPAEYLVFIGSGGYIPQLTAWRTLTTNGTVSPLFTKYYLDASNNDVTLTFPVSSANKGVGIRVKRIDASSNFVNISDGTNVVRSLNANDIYDIENDGIELGFIGQG